MKRLIVGCAACAAIALGTGAAFASVPTIEDLLTDGTVTDITRPNNTQDIYPWLQDAATMVTIDGTGDDFDSAWANMFIGTRQAYSVQYPQSFWPAIGDVNANDLTKYGIFGPTYTESVNTAVARTLQVMEVEDADGEHHIVIYVGYSQGADAAGNALEAGYQGGLFENDTVVGVLLSDPRSPWGIKAWAKDDMGLLGSAITGLLGISNNGARDPINTGDTPIISVVLVGDPVANFQWNKWRPIASIVVDLAGWVTIHGGDSQWSANNLDRNPGQPEVWLSAESGTTYLIYDGPHPVALLQAVIERGLLDYTEQEFNERVLELDPIYQKWYEIKAPTVEDAHVPVVDPTPKLSVAPVEPVVPESAEPATETEESPAPVTESPVVPRVDTAEEVWYTEPTTETVDTTPTEEVEQVSDTTEDEEPASPAADVDTETSDTTGSDTAATADADVKDSDADGTETDKDSEPKSASKSESKSDSKGSDGDSK